MHTPPNPSRHPHRFSNAIPPFVRPLLQAMGGDITARVAVRVAASSPPERCSLGVQQTAEAAPIDDDMALIDRELAHLFAARELYMAWVRRAQEDETQRALNPAQFLRAWSDSTGRVIQLLKARRDLGGAAPYDALLDAVYAELEAQLQAAVAGEQEAAS